MRLKDFLNAAFLRYGQNRGQYDSWKQIDDFIYNPNSCLALLYQYLDVGLAINHSIEWSAVSLYRSQHIMVTFFLGLGLSYHFNILKGVNSINSMPDEYLWMLTAIIHDYGYLDRRLSQFPSLEDEDNKYHLLDDVYTFPQLEVTKGYSIYFSHFLSYPYDVIKKYFEYNRERLTSTIGNKLRNKDNETVDHGIFGACKCYKEYCDIFIKHIYPRYCISSDDDLREVERMGYKDIRIRVDGNSELIQRARTEPLLYKTACLIAAQHNMFRSMKPEQDLVYERFGLLPLLSTAPIAITKKNPLLFLLSIVDTIECSKRFQNIYYNKSNYSKNSIGSFSIPIKQILENVNIELNDVSITINYSGVNMVIEKYRPLFYRDMKRESLHNQLKSQVCSVVGLQDWVKCNSEEIMNYVVRIQI